MPLLTNGRPLALFATAAPTAFVRLATQVAQAGTNAYDAVSVATWALLLCVVARRSKSSLTRDLFGVVVAVAALNGS